MKLTFIHYPVKDLKESLPFYRQLGFEEAWREGDHTVALHMPGTDVQLMLEDDELDIGPGCVFIVDSVDHFYEQNKAQLDFLKEPMDIPPGRYAIYRDPSGNPFRLIDMSKQ
jgi:catechol 2,3-dioxygenase-like lactoylglutathione lyase family enzyme